MLGRRNGGGLTSLILSLLWCVSLALGKDGSLAQQLGVSSGKYYGPLQQCLTDLQQAQKATERELARAQDASERELANARRATTECELRALGGQGLNLEKKSAKRLGVMEEEMARLMQQSQNSIAPSLRQCQSSLAKLQMMQHTREGRNPSSALNLHRLLSPQGLSNLISDSRHHRG